MNGKAARHGDTAYHARGSFVDERGCLWVGVMVMVVRQGEILVGDDSY